MPSDSEFCPACGTKQAQGDRMANYVEPTPPQKPKRKKLIPIVICSCVVVVALITTAFFVFLRNGFDNDSSSHREADNFRFVTIDEFVEKWNSEIDNTGLVFDFFDTKLVISIGTNIAYSHSEVQESEIGIDSRIAIREQNLSEATNEFEIYVLLPDLSNACLHIQLVETLKFLSIGLIQNKIDEYGNYFFNYSELHDRIIGFQLILQEIDDIVDLLISPITTRTIEGLDRLIPGTGIPIIRTSAYSDYNILLEKFFYASSDMEIQDIINMFLPDMLNQWLNDANFVDTVVFMGIFEKDFLNEHYGEQIASWEIVEVRDSHIDTQIFVENGIPDQTKTIIVTVNIHFSDNNQYAIYDFVLGQVRGGWYIYGIFSNS